MDASPFLVVLQSFLLEKRSKENWALKGHSKGALRALEGHLSTRGLGHSRDWSTRALGYLKHFIWQNRIHAATVHHL